jgi:hypothetical protein
VVGGTVVSAGAVEVESTLVELAAVVVVGLVELVVTARLVVDAADVATAVDAVAGVARSAVSSPLHAATEHTSAPSAPTVNRLIRRNPTGGDATRRQLSRGVIPARRTRRASVRAIRRM